MAPRVVALLVIDTARGSAEEARKDLARSVVVRYVVPRLPKSLIMAWERLVAGKPGLSVNDINRSYAYSTNPSNWTLLCDDGFPRAIWGVSVVGVLGVK